ncbi:hypothetical protein ACOMHN_056920 [Nucella lapillus]
MPRDLAAPSLQLGTIKWKSLIARRMKTRASPPPDASPMAEGGFPPAAFGNETRTPARAAPFPTGRHVTMPVLMGTSSERKVYSPWCGQCTVHGVVSVQSIMVWSVYSPSWCGQCTVHGVAGSGTLQYSVRTSLTSDSVVEEKYQ